MTIIPLTISRRVSQLGMQISRITQLRVLLPFALGYFLSYLYRVVNAVISPDLTRELSIGASELGMLTSAYFITFAAAQLPLGILLDRYGPRRIEALLLLIAACGALLFARADSLAGLVLGRGLIGLGVSACLMAAFTAFAAWFALERLPLINGFQMAAGGLGALTATTPVEAALQFTDWRGLFLLLALVTLAASVLLVLVVPKKPRQASGTPWQAQLKGVATVFTSPVFWRIAPWTTLSQASYLSIQGLWAGPWLRDVASLDRMAAAGGLLGMAAGMIGGYLVLGTLATRLSRFGIKPIGVATLGMGTFMVVQLMIVLELIDWARPLWFLFGVFGTAGIISYAELTQRFPRELAGRVNTGLNLLVFIAAFSGQWGIGAVINLWPLTADGGYNPTAYQASFAIVLSLQALGLLWYVLAGILWKASR